MTTTRESLAERMDRVGVRFGTSGARGRVDALSDELCYALTTAFVQHLVETGPPPRRLALAGDRRASTPRIVAACTRALADHGIQAIDCGLIPTPALAAFCMDEGIAGMMITGSHIPEDRNGIKLYTAAGEILKADERAIAAQLVHTPEKLEAFDDAALAPAVDASAARMYVARFVDAYGDDALAGLSVGVYGHSAVGRDLSVEILRRLGATVTALGFSDAFVAVDTEAVREEDRALCRQWAAEHDFDAIVTTDGDGDRPMLADAGGHWLRGDVVGILAASGLGARVVVTPVSSNTAVERCGRFESVVRTRIGSPYVVAAMQEVEGDGVVGYEANGGLLQHSAVAAPRGLLAPLPTRDAMIVAVVVLHAMVQQRRTLAELVGALPARATHSDRLRGIDGDRSRAWMHDRLQDGSLASIIAPELGQAVGVDLTDGVRLTFAHDEIVHIRPSGNAPELRCYCEAATASAAQTRVADVLLRISDALR